SPPIKITYPKNCFISVSLSRSKYIRTEPSPHLYWAHPLFRPRENSFSFLPAMRLLLPLSSLLSLSLAASIWPIPVSLKTGKDVVWFTRNTQFEYSGPRSVGFPSPSSNPLVAIGACLASPENPLAQAQIPTQRVLTPCDIDDEQQTDARYFKNRVE